MAASFCSKKFILMDKLIVHNLIGDLQRAAIDSALDSTNLIWRKNILLTLKKFPSLRSDINLSTAEHLLMSAIRLEQKYRPYSLTL